VAVVHVKVIYSQEELLLIALRRLLPRRLLLPLLRALFSILPAPLLSLFLSLSLSASLFPSLCPIKFSSKFIPGRREGELSSAIVYRLALLDVSRPVRNEFSQILVFYNESTNIRAVMRYRYSVYFQCV